MYSVKEIFRTLQGEGAQTGRSAVFCRFAGCNLWSGREADRADADCQFCDTDFVGTDGPSGGRFEHAAALADASSGGLTSDTDAANQAREMSASLFIGPPTVSAKATIRVMPGGWASGWPSSSRVRDPSVGEQENPVRMAEREGFEPSEPLRIQRFSRPPDSTTLAPLQGEVTSSFRAFRATR